MNIPEPFDQEGQPGRVDIDASRMLAKVVGAEIKQCYYNATMAVMAHANLLPEGVVYVEGWVLILFGLPIEHGWLERADGTIIDPTLVLTNGDDEMAALRYFAARRWSKDEIEQMATKAFKRRRALKLPLLTADGYHVFNEAWWQEAHARMMRAAYPGLDSKVDTTE